MVSLAAVILAGGQSRRMGEDKALLKLPTGQTLLSQTTDIALHLTSEVMVITPWPERYESVVSPHVQLLAEEPHQNGPLGGFSQSWRKVQADWCLLLACDMPMLKREPLADWWDWIQQQIATSNTYAAASLTYRQSRWEPLCGFYHRSCSERLQHLIDTSNAAEHQSAQNDHSYQLSFQSWINSLSVWVYEKLPPSILLNCNTKADWAQIDP